MPYSGRPEDDLNTNKPQLTAVTELIHVRKIYFVHVGTAFESLCVIKISTPMFVSNVKISNCFVVFARRKKKRRKKMCRIVAP